MSKSDYLTNVLPITLTGVRSGEVIEGWRGQSVGTVLEVAGDVGRSSREVKAALENPTFLVKLGSLDVFQGMSLDERRDYVTSSLVEGDHYLEDFGVSVRFLTLGPHLLKTLDEEALDLLGRGEVLPMSKVIQLFPATPGSKGLKGRHTLFFRGGIWKLRRAPEAFSGVCLFRGRFVDDAVGYDVGLPYGIKTSGKPTTLAEANVRAAKILGVEVAELEAVYPELEWMTPAGLKSALQKLIRLGSASVVIHRPYEEAYLVPTRTVVVAVWLKLVFSPGSFVPDLQRFVTGAEGAFKRLVVTVFEDSWVDEVDYNRLALVASIGIVAQRVPGYVPGLEEIDAGVRLVSHAWECSKAWVFSCAKKKPLKVTPESNGLEIAGWLVKETGSFESDVAMISDILSHPKLTTVASVRPESVVLEHVIDQHWAPEIVYHLYLSGCGRLSSTEVEPRRPFGAIVVAIFSRVTGVNPRRPGRDGRTMKPISYSPKYEETTFTIAVRKAQRRIYLSRLKIVPPPPPSPGEWPTRTLPVSLPPAYLAGMVGVIKLAGKPPVMGTIDPSLERLVVIRQPSRDAKTSALTPEREEEALEQLKAILRKGVRGTGGGVKPPLAVLEGAIFYLDDSKEAFRWFVSSPSLPKRTPWDDVINGEIEVPVGVVGGWYGIAEGADERFRRVLGKLTPSEIRRGLTYLEDGDQTIEVTRLSREGGGTGLIPVLEDTGAFYLIWHLTRFYPAGLTPLDSKSFTVVSVIVLAAAIRVIKDYLSEVDVLEGVGEAEGFEAERFENPREMWSHQISALEELSAPGDRKFLWIPVGMGKTQIVMEYLRRVYLEGRLPKRIVYTLPSSAIASVRAEIEMFGLEVSILDGRGKKAQLVQVPTGVVLVEHDHLRLLESALHAVARETWLVIDEVHKCLAETKRSSVALGLSSAARGFIALTGTPVIDANTYRLIWWLKKINTFPITERNFWVAANSMVARKVNTGVRVDFTDVPVDLGGLAKTYAALVPPSLGGRAKHLGPREFRQAMDLSLEAVTPELISGTLASLEEDPQGVFIVAATTAHASEISAGLQAGGLEPEEIFIVGAGRSIFLTDSSGPTEVRVVITTVRHSTGYSLTRFGRMFTSVYPSNQATREQLEGRINRIGQQRQSIEIRTYHAGVLTYIHENHLAAASLSEALKALASEV